MSADEASAVLDHARAVVDAEHALLLESRLERAAPLIRAFRARADALVARLRIRGRGSSRGGCCTRRL